MLTSTHHQATDKVVLYYPSANRDESIFTDPYEFDIERSPNSHLAFGGGGAHYCFGVHLARLELKVLFEIMAERIDRVEPTSPVRRLRSNFISGIKEMPVRIHPR